jgi:tRNA threonylcarbamoyl adenosine modification protein YeaZ
MTASPTGPVLALDTATDQASVAVVDGAGQAMALRQWESRRRHTVELAPTVRQLLLEAGVTAGDLAAVAVAIGPGSYTGLRIGLALAKGLSLATGCPVVGIPTLDIVAAACSPPLAARADPLWSVLTAGRGRFIACRYAPPTAGADSFGGLRPVDWPDPAATRALTPEAILELVAAPAWAAGELSAELAQAMATLGLRVLPQPRDPLLLARMARGRLAAGWRSDPTLGPVYAS